MEYQTCASMVNISAVGGTRDNISTAYASFKWGLEGLSRSAAYVYADWGIRCNTIHPGIIDTDMGGAMMGNPLANGASELTMNDAILLRRAGKPEEIGYTALFLASEDSTYITGNDIVVDGGWFSAAPYLAVARPRPAFGDDPPVWPAH